MISNFHIWKWWDWDFQIPPSFQKYQKSNIGNFSHIGKIENLSMTKVLIYLLSGVVFEVFLISEFSKLLFTMIFSFAVRANSMAKVQKSISTNRSKFLPIFDKKKIPRLNLSNIPKCSFYVLHSLHRQASSTNENFYFCELQKRKTLNWWKVQAQEFPFPWENVVCRVQEVRQHESTTNSKMPFCSVSSFTVALLRKFSFENLRIIFHFFLPHRLGGRQVSTSSKFLHENICSAIREQPTSEVSVARKVSRYIFNNKQQELAKNWMNTTFFYLVWITMNRKGFSQKRLWNHQSFHSKILTSEDSLEWEFVVKRHTNDGNNWGWWRDYEKMKGNLDYV